MSKTLLYGGKMLVSAAGLLIIGVLVWQGITAGGNPDPSTNQLDPAAAVLDTAILVLREGLEAILVLAALTASLVKTEEGYWKPISVGAGLSFVATVITWFVVVGLISLAGSTTSELNIQAGTGILANIVLLVIMNWFFHKIYWTGWISLHNRKKRATIQSASIQVQSFTYRTLLLLGLTSVYREGFEVVLFLQTLRLQVGSEIVLWGVFIGLALVLVVGTLTFFAHRRLPYKRMLILTGIMLCGVLFVMTGETAQEMQLAGWLPTTSVGLHIPAWMGLWLSVFPTVQTIMAQIGAVAFVIGSYFISEHLKVRRQRKNPVSQNASP